VLALLILVVLLGAAGLRIYQLYHRLPEHWVDFEQWKYDTTSEQRSDLATALEQRVAAVANVRDREGIPIGTGDGLGPRTLRVSFAEVNAWLDTALPDFLREQDAWCREHYLAVPPGLAEPMVAGDPAGPGLIISFHYVAGSFSGVISAYCDLAVPREGALTVKVRKVKVNDLRLPRALLVRALDVQPDGLALGVAGANIKQLFDGRTFPAAQPVWGASREAHLTGVAIRPDGLDVTVNLVPRTP
jgi:hypothetical protein